MPLMPENSYQPPKVESEPPNRAQRPRQLPMILSIFGGSAVMSVIAMFVGSFYRDFVAQPMQIDETYGSKVVELFFVLPIWPVIGATGGAVICSRLRRSYSRGPVDAHPDG